MKREYRTLKQSIGQGITFDEVMTRIGKLSYRNFGTFANNFLSDSGKNLIIGDGFRVEPDTGMTVNIPVGSSGSLFQALPDGDYIPVIQLEDQTVTLDAASGVARIDIIEAQIKTANAKTDVSEIATVDLGGTNPQIEYQTIQRDIRYYLSCRKQTDTTTSTAATAAILNGTVAIPGTINLSGRYLINLVSTEDGSFQEIDCRGVDPFATTRTEIIDNINAAAGRIIASAGAGDTITMTGDGTGETSYFAFKPVTSDSEKDALEIIFGLSVGGLYFYEYRGENQWFKLAEIDVGTTTTVITTGLIRNIDQIETWASEIDSIDTCSTMLDLYTKGSYDAIVRTQRDFHDIFEQVSANNYKIKDNIKSVLLKSKTYSLQNLIDLYSDSSAIVKINNCCSFRGEGRENVIIDYAGLEGQIEIDNSCNFSDLSIIGDNSTILTSTDTLFVNSTNVLVANVIVKERLGTAKAFRNFTGSPAIGILFQNCVADGMGAEQFYECAQVSYCHAINGLNDGFSNCTKVDSCFSDGNDIHGFQNCTSIENCRASNNTFDGYSTCDNISGCVGITNGRYGFNLCTYPDSSCKGIGNATANWNTSFGQAHSDQTSCLGSDENGNPVFMKKLTGTILDTLSSVNIAHGIANAYTNDRIYLVDGWIYISASSIYHFPSADDQASYPYRFLVDNTNLIFQRGLNVTTYPVGANIHYK